MSRVGSQIQRTFLDCILCSDENLTVDTSKTSAADHPERVGKAGEWADEEVEAGHQEGQLATNLDERGGLHRRGDALESRESRQLRLRLSAGRQAATGNRQRWAAGARMVSSGQQRRFLGRNPTFRELNSQNGHYTQKHKVTSIQMISAKKHKTQ